MKKIKNIFKNKFLALLAGAFCSLAFAPLHFFIAAMISLSIFYQLLEKSEKKKDIFWLGFSYGFGYFLTGIYWISISLLVDAEKFAWLIPFALTLIPSALALYFACFALSYKFFIKKFKCSFDYQKILLFAICWLFFEVLRSYLFTGFPWNLLGYIWMFDVRFVQLANIFGIYGLSVFAVLICLFPMLFLKSSGLKKAKLGDKILAAILLTFFIGNLFYGYKHIDETKLVRDSQTKLRLIQANIKQEMKWDGAEKYRNFLKHIELTNSQDLQNIKAVIWSETSVPYVIDDNPELMEKLKMAVPVDGVLITGGLRINYADRDKNNIADVWNSVFTINQNGIAAHYDKHHLVPFGEYIPLQKFLPFIEKITEGAVGFSKGEGPKTLEAANFLFSPLLCYEVIFSGAVIDKTNRPHLLVNLTNDAWFGNSSGPYQHFDMARMRAVENGISLVRVAGTGISAFVDPFGRVVSEIALNEQGIIDVDLIQRLEPTIYETHGFLPLILLVTVMFLFLLISPQKKHAHRQNHTH